MTDLDALLWMEQVLETKKELEDLERFAIFAQLRREYEERLLLDEINQDESGRSNTRDGEGNNSN